MSGATKFVLMFAACAVMTGCGNKDKDGGKGTKKGNVAAKVPNTSKKNTAEVRQVFAQLRIGLEQYRVENNAYLSTGKESERWPPVLSHGQSHGALTAPAAWKTLKVKRDPKTLRCSYVVVAGKANDISNVGPIARKRFGMTEVDVRTSSTGQIDRSIKKVPDQEWFYLLAECDGDGDPKRNAFWLLRNDLRNTFRVDRTH